MKTNNSSKSLIVIGGGAAGFFCAINAAKNNNKLTVILIEKSNKLLSKVKISGGGRCNVTHSCFNIVELSKKYPRGENFLKKAFHWFNVTHTIEWFKTVGVELKTESDGRMFPSSNTSETIINCLLNEANKYGVKILLNTDITNILKLENLFELNFKNTSEKLFADFVCIACGGFPKLEQFKWLTQLGHSIETPIPSLFTFNIPNHSITKLMGISVDEVSAKIIGTKFQSKGPILITHWGLSGPAVLKLSAFAARELASKNYQFEININWLNLYNAQNLKDEFIIIRTQYSTQKMYNKNPFKLPNRLWNYLLDFSEISNEIRWCDLTSINQNKLIHNLISQNFKINGKTTFKEEFVTCGGINLNEIDVNTMQSKLIPNLFFAGEILNIDGITGGFNFQNAWTTGWIAAKTIQKLSN